MQSKNEIKQMLEEAGLAPQKRFGQCFLIDMNLMRKLLELAEVDASQTVLEVGPGTGSLTEELLATAGRVVAAEIDHGLCRLLQDRFGGRENFTLVCGDVLQGKHAIEPAVLSALGPRANMVANLPYNIATPLIAQCLLDSWQCLHGGGAGGGLTQFGRLTFTVQREVADRLVAGVESAAYGQISVLVALLARVKLGHIAPASAFWPAPQVESRLLRMDFDADLAAGLKSADTLCAVLAMLFGQRRKQIGAIIRQKCTAQAASEFLEALAAMGIEPSVRAETLAPGQFLSIANAATSQKWLPLGDDIR